MAWAYRASSYANSGTGWSGAISGTNETVTFGAAVSAGDLLVLVAGAADVSAGNVSFVVSDSVNGSWSATADETGQWTDGSNKGRLSIFTFPNSAAGTPVITVKVNTSGTQTFGGLQCAAFSGIATTTPLDVGAWSNGNSNAGSSGASSATTGANELVVGGYFDLGYNTTVSHGTGFTSAGVHQSDGGNWQGMIEYEDSGASGGTQTATFSQGGTTVWAAAVAVYKLSGGAAPSPIRPPMRTLRGVGL